jgi:multicomponent Na+:H+ antiporter subunit E
MGILIINIILAAIWAALTGAFTLPNLITGFVLGYVVLYLLRGLFDGGQYFNKGAQAVKFLLFFLWELLIANLRVARDVLRPGPLKMQPRVIAVPLKIKEDVPIVVLANVLSLTPGSLSLDVSDDHKTLFIHAMHAPDPEETRREIENGFEKLVMNLFSNQVDEPGKAQEHVE